MLKTNWARNLGVVIYILHLGHNSSSSEVLYLAQWHSEMQTRGIKPATSQWQDAGSASEPQPTPRSESWISAATLKQLQPSITFRIYQGFEDLCLDRIWENLSMHSSSGLSKESKILLLVYKALNGLGPKYISDLLLRYEVVRYRPAIRTTQKEAAFSYYAAHIWKTAGIGSNLERFQSFELHCDLYSLVLFVLNLFYLSLFSFFKLPSCFKHL